MVQISQPWDDVVIGDAVRAPYSGTEWDDMFEDMFDSEATRGVLEDRGSELVGTIPGANQFRIASGAALVKGKWYRNDANVVWAVASASAGHWRQDRIVLSCTWANINSAARDPVIQVAQTVRLIRLINPAEDVAAPGVTQTDGILWEISLYRIQVSDAGVVTIHADDRDFISKGIYNGDADTVDGLHANEIGGLYSDYVCVRDVKAQGVEGGGFTQGAWRTRDINNEQADASGICTIAGNQITLAAGTYRCMISAPAHRVDYHQTRLQNITTASTLLTGTSEISEDSAYTTNRSFIVGRFTLAGAHVLEIQHQCSLTIADNGFGRRCDFTEEIYTIAEFWRET